MLAYHRDRIVDQMELTVLRQALAAEPECAVCLILQCLTPVFRIAGRNESISSPTTFLKHSSISTTACPANGLPSGNTGIGPPSMSWTVVRGSMPFATVMRVPACRGKKNLLRSMLVFSLPAVRTNGGKLKIEHATR